jgi:hypothetical protein
MSVLRAYIVPRRNDVVGMNIHLKDLQPNTSQRNSSIDPVGQSGYLPQGADQLGATVLDSTGVAYVSGSRMTRTLVVLADADTDGGGADSDVTTRADYGLVAYLRERIDAGAAGAVCTPAQALDMAEAILALVEAGTPLTEAAIDAALAGVVASSGLAEGDSFGTVEEILRILSGEVYIVAKNTIIATNGGTFRTAAERATAVDNATSTYYEAGRFIAVDESGFRNIPRFYRNTSLNASAAVGDLSVMKGSMTFKNPNFAYAAGEVTSLRPRATDLAGNALPATGAHEVLVVYDYLGNEI